MIRGRSIRNIIAGVIGDLGTGKTLLITAIAYACYLRGYVIIANYHLNFPHIRIEDIKDLDKITSDKSKSYIFVFDEPFISADARLSHSKLNIQISRKVLQSRKMKMHILFTARYIKEIELRMRVVTNWIFIPHIIATTRDNKPLALIVEKYKRNMIGDMDKVGNFTFFTIINKKNMCDMYRTEEIVKEFKSQDTILQLVSKGKLKEYKDIIEKFGVTKGELLSKMTFENPTHSKDSLKVLTDFLFLENKMKIK